jgi:DNA-directed RNA polymerase specialized sigma24 family protein
MKEPLIPVPAHLASIPTRRSMLPRLGDREGPDWESSWTYLFTLYAPAMERYVERVLRQARGAAADRSEAVDLVQTWFHDALAKGWLEREMADIRCFRAWLQVQLRRVTYHHLEARHAQKRDPGRWAPTEALEHVAGGEAAAALDQGLVGVAVEQALAALRAANADYAEIIADLLRTDGEGSPDLGALLDRTPQQLVHLRHRARKRFATLFHERLREIVRDDADYEALLADLGPLLP